MLSEEQLRRYDTDGILPISKAQVQIADLAAALRDERKRVAELGADAKLGRMVREMPEGVSLHHNCNGYDEWSCEYGKTWTWEPTPEAALEAARKEEP